MRVIYSTEDNPCIIAGVHSTAKWKNLEMSETFFIIH